MIDIQSEQMMPISAVPAWCKANIGKRIHPSTVFRWHKRGARGAKLSTLLIGGTRYTSVERLNQFFAASTAAADGGQATSGPPEMIDTNETSLAQEFLRKNGM